MAHEAHAKRARRKISVEDKQQSSFPSLPGPKAVQSFLAKGFGMLRYLIIEIHFFKRDGESGQNRFAFPSRKDGFLFHLAFLIEQIRKKNHIENVPNPPTPSFVEPCIVIRTCPERVSHRGKFKERVGRSSPSKRGDRRLVVLVAVEGHPDRVLLKRGPLHKCRVGKLARQDISDTRYQSEVVEPWHPPRSLNPTKKDLRVTSTIALEEVKAGMARVETSLKEEVEELKATKEKLRIKVSILALRGQWPTECHTLSQLQE
ncbi:hypothetical protein VNO80_03204 [Phaseolus coccineus]|uniref:Uncharacterized protein n=1 Tax=Phaseolus coccineus TaxID=3886 RepID=A0AAN9NRS5_PHACN